MADRFERLDELKRVRGIDAFLLTSSATVRYLGGYFYNFEIGPSPFQLIPAALFVDPPRYARMIVADSEDTSTVDPRISVIHYASYTYEKPLDPSGSFLEKLCGIIDECGAARVRLGIESGHLPAVVYELLSARYPGMRFVDVSADTARIRMIKAPDEIASIRNAVGLSDIGQAAAMKHARPGITELELFTLIRGEMELAAGQRIPLMADLVSGERTFTTGGSPSKKVIESGDLILSDLTPCLNGYWGDTCTTFVVGSAGTAGQKRDFRMVKDALDAGIHAVRPGARACDVDGAMRALIAGSGNFPHHGGHGVGTVYHEEPRITPYNTLELAPGMVVALEPGVYRDGYGIRLEHVVVVTESGCEVLSKFEHCFDQCPE